MELISKYDLIERIVQTTDENILAQIKHVLEEQNMESGGTMNRKLNAALSKSIKQADSGQVIPHSKVMADIKKKYQKK